MRLRGRGGGLRRWVHGVGNGGLHVVGDLAADVPGVRGGLVFGRDEPLRLGGLGHVGGVRLHLGLERGHVALEPVDDGLDPGCGGVAFGFEFGPDLAQVGFDRLDDRHSVLRGLRVRIADAPDQDFEVEVSVRAGE